MKIIFPDSLELSRWQKFGIESALSRMLKGGHFDICTVDQVSQQMRKEGDKELREELRLLHCEDYKNMPSDIQADLIERLGQYLGIQIEGWTSPGEKAVMQVFTLVPAFAITFFAGMGVAFGAVSMVDTHKSPPLGSYASYEAPRPSMPPWADGPSREAVAQPLHVIDDETALDDSRVVLYDLSVESRHPGRMLVSMAPQLNRLTKYDRYRVKLKVEGVSKDAEK
ncbi:hypothetical protein [Chromobacterium haemolyticum]|uniref:hypothetical protein n=1 Tax=Chromobacterium haemolyticum TaxID=394935 RepID=UPI00244755B9|nr:hypothetical protein [Chromobacterium haemolyticum]MDH0342062.1 hypothetical protein [Chromobacterium haemolyticum]